MQICNETQLPTVVADFCSPNLNFGQIKKIYLGYASNPLADWNDLAEWNTRLDNSTEADLTKIRFLHVIADKPAAEKSEIEFSQNRKAYTTPDHTINLSVDETGNENYALIQFLEDNAGKTVQMWYEAGKYLYGGNSGIPVFISLNDVIPESDEELNTFDGTATWQANHPDRIVNPMA